MLFRRKRTTSDFSAEIQAHVDLEIERLQEQGLTREDARTAALRSFGNVTQAQERFYESGRWMVWEHFCHDIRYAARMLRKAPGFTAVAVLTIALGIGASTAIFSVVNATLLHPLPYPHPEQLVEVQDDLPGIGATAVGFSEPEWRDLQRSGIFQQVSPDWYDENNLTGSSVPARVALSTVATNYFELLGVKAQMGRTFDLSKNGPGYTLEVVISDGLWKRAFASDPNVLGRSLRLDTDLYRIVGVMPPGFRPPGHTPQERGIDVWAACSFYGAPLADHPARNVRLIPRSIARLAPGLTIAQAQVKLDALVASLQKQYPGDYPPQAAWRIRLLPLQQTIVGDVRLSLVLLLGAVSIVLLIGCVNIANLLLTRASARAREMAIRQAVGAARKRLATQLLTESILLSLLGGVAGIAVLFATRRFLLRLVPDTLPRLNDISINWFVLLFALAACLLSAVLFGLAPTLQVGRFDLVSTLKDAARGSTGSVHQARIRRLLVVSEFALSVVLMISAGLLLRSFWDLLNVHLGFDPQGVMTVRTRLPYPNDPTTALYRTPAQQSRFVRELLRRNHALPGVEQAAIGNFTSVPLDHPARDQNLVRVIFEGRPAHNDDATLVNGANVTPEYFSLLNMKLLRGRLFTDSDNEDAPHVAVINEAMAQTYWPNEDPIGKHLKFSPRETSWATVIGVVANARTESLEETRIPQVYATLYQEREHHLAIFLRGRLDAATIPDQVRQQVQAVDGTLPVFGAQMLAKTVSSSLSQRRFSMQMVGLFALTALMLAAIGIYGVISYIVNERRHEIGIRMALGAQNRNIRSLVLRQGLRLAITGSVLGLVGALIVSRWIAGVLYGVRPTDPITFAAVVVLLIGVALVACYIPARRATRVDPLIAIHES